MVRALSKLGVLSRKQAIEAALAGRITVNGRIVRDPGLPIAPETAAIALDGVPQRRITWRTIMFHKPRGVLTTRRDPGGRRTIYDVLGAAGEGLIAVGRLDLASSGLLLLTTDTGLANRITEPASRVQREYVVTVRGELTDREARQLVEGVLSGRERLRAERVIVRKASARESHCSIELREGRNREVRRLCEAIGHDVTRLKRIRLGRLDLGDLAPGEWRELTRAEVDEAFGTTQ